MDTVIFSRKNTARPSICLTNAAHAYHAQDGDPPFKTGDGSPPTGGTSAVAAAPTSALRSSLLPRSAASGSTASASFLSPLLLGLLLLRRSKASFSDRSMATKDLGSLTLQGVSLMLAQLVKVFGYVRVELRPQGLQDLFPVLMCGQTAAGRETDHVARIKLSVIMSVLFSHCNAV